MYPLISFTHDKNLAKIKASEFLWVFGPPVSLRDQCVIQPISPLHVLCPQVSAWPMDHFRTVPSTICTELLFVVVCIGSDLILGPFEHICILLRFLSHHTGPVIPTSAIQSCVRCQMAGVKFDPVICTLYVDVSQTKCSKRVKMLTCSRMVVCHGLSADFTSPHQDSNLDL